jgi:glyoxylase-like metal-dependent hydrolase (beta-lactamase superfamily II)/rhodanese-related sulfurtransferase
MLLKELNRGKCKTYLIGCERTHRAALIDPLRENTARYLAAAAYHGYKLDYLIDTHTHADHRSGTFDLADLCDAKVVMERHAPAPHVAIHVSDGDVIELGDLHLKFLYTPGHTPDGLSVVVGNCVFTGDTLLIGGTGRADFSGGDAGAQYDAITRKLFALADETIVYPAHDYRGNIRSTIGAERTSNPRVAGRSREQYVTLMANLGLPLPDKIQEALQSNQSAIEDDSVKFPDVAQLSAIHQTTVSDLNARLSAAKPPHIIDVREPEEFNAELGHIRSAQLVPLKTIPARAAQFESIKSDEVVVVCRSGVRSTTAAAMLTALGFDRVSNLKGGMLEWNDARLPVER